MLSLPVRVQFTVSNPMSAFVPQEQEARGFPERLTYDRCLLIVTNPPLTDMLRWRSQ